MLVHDDGAACPAALGAATAVIRRAIVAQPDVEAGHHDDRWTAGVVDPEQVLHAPAGSWRLRDPTRGMLETLISSVVVRRRPTSSVRRRVRHPTTDPEQPPQHRLP